MNANPAQAEGFEWGRWLRCVGFGALVMITGGVTTAIGSALIQSRYPDRPSPPDLLFDLLPYASWTQFAVEAVYIASLLLLVVYLWRHHHIRRVPELMALYGLMDIGRALIMVLTPLGIPYEEAMHFNPSGGLMRQWGEFPSGHMATMLLFYLAIDGEEAPGIKRTVLVMMLAEVVVLLTSHSHYSIDIVGGLLLGYFVFYQYYRGRLFDWLKPFVRV